MVFLTATLPPHTKPEFMNIMRISADDVHMFRAATSRPNIAYSAVEYEEDEEDELGRGDITASVLSSDTVVITAVNRSYCTTSCKYRTTEKLQPCKAVLQPCVCSEKVQKPR
jgi:superfamily II DNA helicase RecQ